MAQSNRSMTQGSRKKVVSLRPRPLPQAGAAGRGPEMVGRRPPWETYFMRIAQLVASRSTCLRRQVGAVIVRDNRILATGYNGAPNAVRHCFEVPGGCLRESQNIPSGQRQELCRGLHAEQNAILQAAAFGVVLKGSEVYCTHQPCITCAKMLINAGITRVIFLGDYPDSLALDMLREGNIKLERIGID
jgi:dCMP deaminase